MAIHSDRLGSRRPNSPLTRLRPPRTSHRPAAAAGSAGRRRGGSGRPGHPGRSPATARRRLWSAPAPPARRVVSAPAARPRNRLAGQSARDRLRREAMKLGYFTMPLHPPGASPADTLASDLEQLETLDRLGFAEAWIGEHITSEWENIPAPDLLIAQALARTTTIRLGTGVSCLPNHDP